MTATLDTHEALFLMLKKLRDDDSGAGGLANSTGNQYLPTFLRAWEVRTEIAQPPYVEVEVVDDVDQSAPGSDSPNMRARMHLFTPHTPVAVMEQAILTRMRSVYRGTSIGTAQGGYNGCRIKWWRSPRAPSAKPALNHRVVEITVKLTA